MNLRFQPAIDVELYPGLNSTFHDQLGLRWQFFKQYLPDRFELKNGELILRAEENLFANSSLVLVNSHDRKCEVQVEYSIDNEAVVGLSLFNKERANLRISVDTEKFTIFNQQNTKIRAKNEFGNHGFCGY